MNSNMFGLSFQFLLYKVHCINIYVVNSGCKHRYCVGACWVVTLTCVVVSKKGVEAPTAALASEFCGTSGV